MAALLPTALVIVDVFVPMGFPSAGVRFLDPTVLMARSHLFSPQSGNRGHYTPLSSVEIRCSLMN
jgi:hypothetical protein